MSLPLIVLLVTGLLAPPTVTSLSPSAATAGGGGFTLTVTGTEFRRNAVVLWNGDHRPTTWVSETRLEAAIAAADIAGPGTVEVRVLTRGARGGQSAPIAFIVTTATTAGSITNNPVPSVASLSPATAVAGGESFRLIVTGGGFSAGAVVRWSGAAKTTTRHSSTSLSAIIDRTDVAAVGSARVSVFNPAPGGGVSAEQVLRILHAAPVVSSLTPSTAVAGSGDVVVAIAGRNFIRSVQAYWNNSARNTVFVGPAAIRMTVPAADLRSTGTAQVTLVTTVDQSSMRSAPSTFTISLPPQTTTTATPQLVVDRFYVGGEGNPAWVTAGQAVPLHALVIGVAPTHWRIAENAQLTGAEWRAVAGVPTYIFPSGTTGSRTLWYQVRFGDGTSATVSNIVSDGVEVVRPYSTAGVTTEPYGLQSGERVRVECPAGQVMTGVHGDSGLWLDNVGVVCADRKGPYAYTAIYGGLGAPATFDDQRCPLGSAPGAIGLYESTFWRSALGKPVVSCPYLPPQIGHYFPVAMAEAVGGERETFEGGVHCPAPAFPVGMDVWLIRTATGGRAVSALGLICARLRS